MSSDLDEDEASCCFRPLVDVDVDEDPLDSSGGDAPSSVEAQADPSDLLDLDFDLTSGTSNSAGTTPGGDSEGVTSSSVVASGREIEGKGGENDADEDGTVNLAGFFDQMIENQHEEHHQQASSSSQSAMLSAGSKGVGREVVVDSNATGCSSDVRSKDAVAGICGLRNFANTCYMNSGLQCLLATPTMVRFFTETCPSERGVDLHLQHHHQHQQQQQQQQPPPRSTSPPPKDRPSDRQQEDDAVCSSSLSGRFGPLLKDVWAGEYSLLKPVHFKDTLEAQHPQFKGAHQHDCQEFLALLLDSLHEELKLDKSNRKMAANNSDCGTSMELHTPHSTERETALTISWLSRNSSLDGGGPTSNALIERKLAAAVAASSGTAGSSDVSHAAAVLPGVAPSSISGGGLGGAGVASSAVHLLSSNGDACPDGTESRGSASPKSFDSHSSSVEDKVTSAIRRLPIPNEIKRMLQGARTCGEAGNCEESMEEDVESLGNEDDDNTMDSNASSSNNINPTSNLITPDSLRRHNNVRFAAEVDKKSGPLQQEHHQLNSAADNNNISSSNNNSSSSCSSNNGQQQLDEKLGKQQEPSSSSCNSSGNNSSDGGDLALRLNDYYYLKENKTLNVNVLADGNQEMNNEINFDSEKFSRLDKVLRPQETIDNLSGGGGSGGGASAAGVDVARGENGGPGNPSHLHKIANFKRLKTTNFSSNGESEIGGSSSSSMDPAIGDADYRHRHCVVNAASAADFTSCDFNGIKRMRLDSSDREKNVQFEMERQQHGMMSASGGYQAPRGGGLLPGSAIMETDEDGEPRELNVCRMIGGESSSSSSSSSSLLTSNRRPDNGPTSSSSIVLQQWPHPINTVSNSAGRLDPGCLKEAIEADRCWEKYLAANDTVVARTFQGQFKNTVICSVCHYVSVSFEPFMYLPLPLPNAHIRQVTVTYVSGARGVRPTTYMLDMTQADNVGNLKEKVLEMSEGVGGGRRHRRRRRKLQVVEVLNHHISRSVDDWTALKYLKEDRQVYIVEVLGQVEDAPDDDLVVQGPAPCPIPGPVQGPVMGPFEGPARSEDEALAKVPLVSSSSSSSVVVVGPPLVCDSSSSTDLSQAFKMGDEHGSSVDNDQQQQCDSTEMTSSTAAMAAGLGAERTGVVDLEDSSKATAVEETSSAAVGDDAAITSSSSAAENIVDVDVDPDVTTTLAAASGCGSGDYHSCVICMDDLPADQMRQHNACDCVMCAPCLERTIEHHQMQLTGSMSNDFGFGGSSNNNSNCNGAEDFASSSSSAADKMVAAMEGLIRCPGCRQDANPATEFVTLDQVGKLKPKAKTLSLPVVCRLDAMNSGLDNNRKYIRLFGHPALVSVNNQVTGRQLRDILLPAIPSVERGQEVGRCEFQLVLVNAQGKNCSRCILNTHCYGCIRIDPEDDQSPVLLQPSDTVAISYLVTSGHDEARLASGLEEACRAVLHESAVDRPKIPDRLRLDDCLAAFSESETLDENNPWFCPICRRNQCATKKLTVWRFPDFLILYLKRFVFVSDSAGAVKLDKDVEFKLTDLDLTPYLSGPLQGDDVAPVFNLYGCVCHFGSVYGGHYTAFSRHLGSGQWNYFDDCSVNEKKAPGDSPGDFSSAYILFYQRAGSRQDSQLPPLSRKCRAFALLRKGCQPDDVENGADDDHQLRHQQLPSSTSSPPPLPESNGRLSRMEEYRRPNLGRIPSETSHDFQPSPQPTDCSQMASRPLRTPSPPTV